MKAVLELLFSRCERDGILPNPEDCTMYIKCVKGTSQDLKCREGFKFDSLNLCTPDEKADCGRMMIREFREDEQCPEYYGWFKVESDCHKFMVCIAGVPTIKSCPEHYIYNDVNGACVEGDKCPISHQASNSN
ncbi:uncharacterized protein CEXT_564901 [Caerostris extrusa]|uniref:Chitin-binding type-2 domain-containing protein n=1 Tax=Caerostris extrusa TaxID=172846 RepID=A0AAV4QBE6_CAEEX|nr:uncharacterized protein CEXT_564901 [Caerostris extrusa]